MKKILGFSVVGLILVSSVLLVSCKSASKNVALEAAFPANADLAVVVDYSKLAQRANFEELIGRFPKIEGTDAGVAMMVAQMDMGLKQVGLSWAGDFQPIFAKPWKMGVALTFPEDKSGDKPDLRALIGNIHVSFAFQLDASDKFEDSIAKLLKENKSGTKVETKDEGGVKYWVVDGKSAMVRYGDVFVVSTNADDLTQAAQQLKDGSGLAKDGSFVAFKNGVAAENLGYMYMGKGFLAKYVAGVQSLVGKSTIVDDGYLNAIGSIFASLSAEKDGFRTQEITELNKDSKLLADVYPDANYKTVFDKKIPAKGMMFYLEDGNFKKMLKPVLNVVGKLAYPKSYLFKETGLPNDPAKDAVTTDLYTSSMKYVADRSGLTVAELETLISSPYSVVMSDVGQVFPTASLYWQLDASKMDSGKKLVAAVDKNIDDILKGVSDIGVAKDGMSFSFKKDSVVVRGGGVHKIAISWKDMPAELMKMTPDQLAAMKAAGLDLTNLKMDLNYGITGDNVLVLSLYPDFSDDYGKNVLADDAQYKEALTHVNATGGAYGIGYADMAKFVGIFKKFGDFGMSMGSLNAGESPAQIANIKKVFDTEFAFFATVKYMISTEVLEGNLMKKDAYIRIEKVVK